MIRLKRNCVITLSGYSRVGKDTVVRVLREAIDAKIERVAFADEVRQFAHDFYGLPASNEWWDEHKQTPLMELGEYGAIAKMIESYGEAPTGRGLLVVIGMQMRKRDPDHWLNRGRNRILEKFRGGAQLVVVTDARFANEVHMFRADGRPTVSWRIRRPGTVPIGSADAEVDLIPDWAFDAEVQNDGTIEHLREQLVNSLLVRGVVEYAAREA